MLSLFVSMLSVYVVHIYVVGITLSIHFALIWSVVCSYVYINIQVQ